MKTLPILLWGAGALVLVAATGCEIVAADTGTDEAPSLRAALARSPEELELADLPGRRAVAERMLQAARTQAELGERERLPAQDPADVLDAVGSVDGERDARGAEPLLFAAVDELDDELQVLAVGDRELFTVERLAGEQVDPRLRVDVGFGREASEALGGRSEAQVVETLSGFLGALGQQTAGEAGTWTVMRRPGLRAAAVLLVDDGIVELNPAFLYYVAALTRPVAVVAAAPAVAGGPDSKPPADDWQIFLRWLQSADPSSWTNLGTGESQSYDAGYYDDTPSPNPLALCPCCWCSAAGLGSGVGGGLGALLGVLLPLGALLLIRRRG